MNTCVERSTLKSGESMETLIELYRKLGDLHVQVYGMMSELRKNVGAVTNEHRVDLAYLSERIGRLCDDMRKECDTTHRLMEKVVCAVWVSNSLNDDGEDCICGEYATGRPDVKQSVKLPHPKRDAEKFKLLASRLGIFGAALKNDLVRIHWPTMSTYVSKLISEGKPLPPGIDRDHMYPVYSLKLRETRNPLEENSSNDKEER